MLILLWYKNFTTNDIGTFDALALVNHAEIFIVRQLIKNKSLLTCQDYVREVVAVEKIFVINFAALEVHVFLENIFLPVVGGEKNFRARIDIIFNPEIAREPADTLMNVKRNIFGAFGAE